MPGKSQQEQRPVEVVWEAPPEQRGFSMYNEAIDEVKKRPGSWARVRILPSSSGAYSAQKTLRNALGSDEKWETRVARMEKGGEEHGIWIRYRTDEQMKAARKA